MSKDVECYIFFPSLSLFLMRRNDGVKSSMIGGCRREEK